MNIEQKLHATTGFTPTEQQLAVTVLAMGERVQGYSIKEFAAAARASSTLSSLNPSSPSFLQKRCTLAMETCAAVANSLIE